MNFKEFDAYVKEQVVKGFETGYKFQEFKTDEVVGVFTTGLRETVPSLKEGTISHKFEEGKTRRIVVRLGDGVEHTIKGNQQIKNHIFKKVEVDKEEQVRNSPVLIFKDKTEEKEESAQEVEPEIKEQPIVEELKSISGNVETIVVERAMTPKNPTVKKYLADGWIYKGREWNNEKYMYLSTLERQVN